MSNVRKGQVNPDDLIQITFIGETPEDRQLLARLEWLFREPEHRTEAQRLAIAVLTQPWESTPLAMLVDEATAFLAASDKRTAFVSRAQIIDQLEDEIATIEACTKRRTIIHLVTRTRMLEAVVERLNRLVVEAKRE